MITTATHFQARNHAALCAKQPKLTVRPLHAVFGWTEAQKADFNLSRDRNALASAEANFAAACELLGRANKRKGLRRMQQAAAMGCINRARAELRRARAALATSLAAVPALAA
jgi:hypothetical protein